MKQQDGISVYVYNITYNTQINEINKFPKTEIVNVPSCFVTNNKDYSWYIRSHLEHKYHRLINGFEY